MKLLIALAFVALAVAQMPVKQKVCFPTEFTMNMIIREDNQDDVAVTRNFFSVSRQKERIDYDVLWYKNQPDQQAGSFIFDYPAGIWYEITYSNTSSATCIAHQNLTGTLEPRCLSKKAEHRGTITLGGVIECDNWIDIDHDKHVAVDILMDKNVDIPVRAHFRSKTKGGSSEEYWDFMEHVKDDDFKIPPFCNNAQVVENSNHHKVIADTLRIPQGVHFN